MDRPEYQPDFDLRAVQDARQAEVDAKFDEMREAIDVWELRAEDAYNPGNETELKTILNEAIYDMDEKWGLSGHDFLVVGRWRHRKLEVENESAGGLLSEGDINISSSIVEDDAFSICTNLGFSWRRAAGAEGRPRLGMMFAAEEKMITEPYVSFHFQDQPVAFPEDISLTYVPQVAYEEAKDLEARIKYTLELQSEITKLYMGRPEFLAQTQRRQQKLIESIVEAANQVIVTPGRKVLVDVHAALAYLRVDQTTPYGYKKIKMTPLAGQNRTNFNAELVGVDILERSVVDAQRITQENQFIDKKVGLCMILETTVAGKDGKQRLYVPVDEAVIEEHGIRFE